jgi:hypothetical protein
MNMKNWVKGNVEAAKKFFEMLVDMVWLLFAACMWMCVFLLPVIAVSVILSICGLNLNSSVHITSLRLSTAFAIILICALPYFYIYKVRNQKVSTSYKFFLMCTFALGWVLVENGVYQYYAEHCQAGVTKVRAVDAQTKEAIEGYSVSSPESKWGDDFSKGRGCTYGSQDGGMELLWLGCEPVTSTISADGYESKTIILKPNRIDTVTVELQKIKSVQEK